MKKPSLLICCTQYSKKRHSIDHVQNRNCCEPDSLILYAAQSKCHRCHKTTPMSQSLISISRHFFITPDFPFFTITYCIKQCTNFSDLFHAHSATTNIASVWWWIAAVAISTRECESGYTRVRPHMQIFYLLLELIRSETPNTKASTRTDS